jgi:hypothetical protein
LDSRDRSVGYGQFLTLSGHVAESLFSSFSFFFQLAALEVLVALKSLAVRFGTD